MSQQASLLPIRRIPSPAFDLTVARTRDFRFTLAHSVGDAVFFQCPTCGHPIRSEGDADLADELEDAECYGCRDRSDPRLVRRSAVS